MRKLSVGNGLSAVSASMMVKSSSYLRYALIATIAVAISAFLIAAWHRVDRVIAVLASERFDETVERLLVDGDACLYKTGIKFGQEDLPEMLYNRHCVDVIEQIAALREADRDNKCREVFSLFFARHTAAVRRSLDHLEDRKSPRNTQSMKLSESGVCTAMLATALHAGTSTLLSQFAGLDGFRDEIDRRLAANAHLYPNSLPVAANTRNYYVPDNRFQLNALCLHAARLSGAPAQKAMEICSRLEKNEIGNANPRARTSWFDIPNRLAGVPTVRTQGTTNYVLYDWPSELDHDHTRQRLVIDELRKSLAANLDSDR